MRIGVVLPSFRDDAAALDVAEELERRGLDGVFCYDHLWPMGQPERPALNAYPLLGAVAVRTRRVTVGTLVARVGLAPDGVLVASLLSLARIAGGRFVAGIGAGDSLSAPENLAYGVPFEHAAVRRRSLEGCVRTVAAAGVPVWVGGRSAAAVGLAVAAGAALNVWDAPAIDVAQLSERCEVTWGGPLAGDAVARARRLGELADAGATWAVCPWPRTQADQRSLLEAAAAVGAR